MPAPIDGIELGALLWPFENRKGVLLAVSGGADSTALMLLASRWREAGGATPLMVATVDHGLRPGAAGECLAVTEAAARLGLASLVLTASEAPPASGLQEHARTLRYRLLEGAAARLGFDTVATAHTLDDQAETVLMRLARGSSLDGLAAMRAERRHGAVVVLRPLLGVRRDRLVATLEDAGLTWIEDPSNRDPRFERVRLRRLAAALAQAGLTPQRLAVLARRAARASDALAALAQTLLDDATRPAPSGECALDATLIARAPAELRLRVMQKALEGAKGGAGRPPLRLERIEQLCAALDQALDRGATLRRTLAGQRVVLDEQRLIRLSAEVPRRRGAAKRRRGGPSREFHEDLGKLF